MARKSTGTNSGLCFICQKARRDPSTDGGLLCLSCATPKHRHIWRETMRLGEERGGGILYSECECGATDMGTWGNAS